MTFEIGDKVKIIDSPHQRTYVIVWLGRTGLVARIADIAGGAGAPVSTAALVKVAS
jgi:hypothetical protein